MNAVANAGWGRRIFSAMGVMLAALLIAPANAQESDGLKSLVNGNTAFALDLYGRLKTTDGNLFFSPFSISSCLAMTCAGARNATRDQMAGALHFGPKQSETDTAFGELKRRLDEAGRKDGVELDMADSLWAQQGHPFLPSFLDHLLKDYSAGVTQTNFSSNPEGARQAINKWTGDHTANRIQDILPSGTVTPATRLVLVNAIYFKGRWERPFSRNLTATVPFSIKEGQQVQTPMMNLNAEFRYGEDGDIQALELPYAGGSLSMVVLLPKRVDGIAGLESSLTGARLDQWLKQLFVQKVNVFLPRFKMTRQYELGGALSAMGMADAFGPKADFSGMDGTTDLFISAVAHKAFVENNEEGTEAAAATGTVISAKVAVLRPVPVFRADHPFVFLIRDTTSGSILFMGRVADPAS